MASPWLLWGDEHGGTKSVARTYLEPEAAAEEEEEREVAAGEDGPEEDAGGPSMWKEGVSS